VTAQRADFLPAAKADLQRLEEDDPQLPRLALRKVRDLITGAAQGQSLAEMAATGDLSDCRKVYFGPGQPPTHRIVYRENSDGDIEVIEIVAIEARKEMYAYLLAAVRLKRLPAESKSRFDRVHQSVIARRGVVRKTRRRT
jgi:ParE toxin of type II toxin-antitoxin system, parDE